MNEADGGTVHAADDGLLDGMRIERVTRPDGRYLLYFAWPRDAGPDDPDEPPAGTTPGNDHE